MGFPRLHTCCCGCDLRSGSLVIAWINMVCFTLSLLKQALVVTHMSKVNQEVSMQDVVSLITGIVGTIMSLGLLIGIYKRNICILKTWIIMDTVLAILSFICTVYFAVSVLSSDILSKDLPKELPSDILKDERFIFIMAYVFLVVISLMMIYAAFTIFVIYSYRRQLMDEKHATTQFSAIPQS